MKNKYSINKRMFSLVAAMVFVIAIILGTSITLIINANSKYTDLVHNVTTASKFNQEFKSNIDLKMYYYVIESQYSEGLPIKEVHDAQELSEALIETTSRKESRQAITSVLDLCRNLEEKMYGINEISNYDERISHLQNNIYVMTALIEEYMYNYIYNEAVEMNEVHQELSYRLVVEIILIIIVTAAAIFLLLKYVVFLGRSITKPIVGLSKRAKDVAGGDMSVQKPIDSNIEEINILGIGFENMVERLNIQIQENNMRQESLRKAELALLQAQINPHFLYNTMDTIIWLIEANKTEEAVNMVLDLAGFFRNSLSKGEDIITIEQEERHVRSYLQIQQVRYRDKMSYMIDIDPAIYKAILPKLTLQPLVENALYHGIKHQRNAGYIYITGRAEGENAVLQVKDNGLGMSEEKLKQLQDAMLNDSKVGFGLSAVNERLKLQFGEDHGLSVMSMEGVGTTITLRIPLIKKEGSA